MTNAKNFLHRSPTKRRCTYKSDLKLWSNVNNQKAILKIFRAYCVVKVYASTFNKRMKNRKIRGKKLLLSSHYFVSRFCFLLSSPCFFSSLLFSFLYFSFLCCSSLRSSSVLFPSLIFSSLLYPSITFSFLLFSTLTFSSFRFTFLLFFSLCYPPSFSYPLISSLFLLFYFFLLFTKVTGKVRLALITDLSPFLWSWRIMVNT